METKQSNLQTNLTLEHPEAANRGGSLAVRPGMVGRNPSPKGCSSSNPGGLCTTHKLPRGAPEYFAVQALSAPPPPTGPGEAPDDRLRKTIDVFGPVPAQPRGPGALLLCITLGGLHWWRAYRGRCRGVVCPCGASKLKEGGFQFALAEPLRADLALGGLARASDPAAPTPVSPPPGHAESRPP